MRSAVHEPLRVLVAESHVGAATATVRELRRRGHEVVSCAPPSGSAAPCIALSNEGDCPFDDVIDVVVDVHGEAGHRIRTGELPAVCAMRLEVPVVAVGPPHATACITWATARCSDADAGDICEAIGQRR